MLKLEDVFKTYENGTKALKGINLTIEDGEFVFVVGPSGSGKSTIIKMLTAEVKPTSGKVSVNGYDIGSIKQREIPYLRRTVGVVFQDFRLIENKSVYENVAFVMRAVGTPQRLIKKRVTYVLDLVGEAEGSMAGSMIRFVNAVAEAVEEEFPDVVIDTLAYQYTRKPPKLTRPRHNVSVRLCSIECCFLHPLRTCRQDDPDAPNIDLSQPFAEDLIGWGKMCSRLYVWDYVTNFSHYWMPHPNFRVLTDNVRFFAENGVKGVFEQGCAAQGGGEFTGLRAYILSKALWNPNLDEQLLMEEYLNGVYGQAGPVLKRYLDTVYTAADEAGRHLYCFNHPDKPWHTMELVVKCEQLFDEAEKLADNDEILHRIRKQRLAVRYLRILLTPKGSAERNALIDAFEPDAKEYGLTMIWERRDLDFCLQVLRGREEPGYWWAN